MYSKYKHRDEKVQNILIFGCQFHRVAYIQKVLSMKDMVRDRGNNTSRYDSSKCVKAGKKFCKLLNFVKMGVEFNRNND